MDRLTSIEDAALETTTYAYDGNGNRTSVTNTRGKTTTYAYDALNRRTSVTDPLSEVTSYTYDAASRLTQRTDARGLITKYLYDNADRLTSVEHRLANNTLVDTITYAYDNANRRTSMADPAGTTTYAYDNADRLTSVTSPGSQVVSYLYDDAGNRTRVTYPDTKQVNYGYDAANRLVTVTDWLTNVTTYTYDDAGRLASLAYPNGVDTTYGYDDADRLLSLVNGNGSTFSSFAYTLDDVGNRTQVVANNGTTTCDYDDLYRLTEVTYPGPSTDTYTYDELGNRLTKDATSYTYDDGDRMTAAGGVSYTYDDNGNQTARGTDTFTWDHENRLTQSVVGGVTSSSVYYGNGVRRSHTVNGVTTTYTWDVNASLPVVLQDGTNTYVYGLDLISATDGSGDQVYFSYDGLGSVTDITDDVGVVTDTYAYDVFGAVSAHSGSSASPWKFTGEQHEGAAGDTGYYFLRARYYDVDLGRFISRDPIEFDQRYAYANGNPVLYVDPAGLSEVPHAPASMRERLVFSEADSGERARTNVDCRKTSCIGGVGKPSKPYGYNAVGDYLSSCTSSVLSRYRDCAESTKAGGDAVRPVVEPVVDAATDPSCFIPAGWLGAATAGYFLYPPGAPAYLAVAGAVAEAAVTGCLVR